MGEGGRCDACQAVKVRKSEPQLLHVKVLPLTQQSHPLTPSTTTPQPTTPSLRLNPLTTAPNKNASQNPHPLRRRPNRLPPRPHNRNPHPTNHLHDPPEPNLPNPRPPSDRRRTPQPPPPPPRHRETNQSPRNQTLAPRDQQTLHALRRP